MIRKHKSRSETASEPLLNRGERAIGIPVIGIFILLAALGSYLKPPAQGIVWTLAFALIAGRCLQNSWQCARIVCLVTGPLYLVLAGVSLLRTLGVVALPWRKMWFIFYGGTALAFGGEFLLSAKFGSKYLQKLKSFVRRRYTLSIWGAVSVVVILVLISI